MGNNKKYGFILILILFIIFYFADKGTYSSDVTSDAIKFNYSLDVDSKDMVIKYITKDTKVSELINKISVSGNYTLDVKVLNSDGKIKNTVDNVNTGDILSIKVDNNEFKYGLSVIADANGDGVVSLTDLSQLRKHISGVKISETGELYKKEGLYYQALDMNRDNSLTLSDLSKLRKMITGTDEIYSVKLNIAKLELEIGESYKLEYDISPSNVTDKSVKWASSNKDVATVSNGVVKAVGEGETVITVTTSNSNKKATAKVIVSENLDVAILPTGNETIEFQEYKDTLKVWIEKITRTGKTPSYITHIWVKDPYKQFKEQIPDNFGEELLATEKLLANAVKKNKLENKLVVGVNASGFVLDGIWATDFVEANPGYNKTSTCPLVLDGVDEDGNLVIKRDYSGDKPLPWYYTIYGMNKNGDLQYFNYKSKTAANMTEEEIIEWNKSISKKIQNAGFLYTFAFNPVLVKNGEVALTDYWIGKDGSNIRQGFCQIDNNNFVFITDKYTTALNGFSYSEMAEYMVGLGCKTGFNLDGGGSTTLVYKKSTEENVKVVWGVNGSNNGNRPVADMIYFHE